MLNEWIQYIDDPTSKIITPPSLGEHWTTVPKAAREGNLVSVSQPLEDTVGLWDAFLRKAALRLRARLGVDLRRRITKLDQENSSGRTKRLTADTLSTGTPSGVLRIPDAVSDVALNVGHSETCTHPAQK